MEMGSPMVATKMMTLMELKIRMISARDSMILSTSMVTKYQMVAIRMMMVMACQTMLIVMLEILTFLLHQDRHVTMATHSPRRIRFLAIHAGAWVLLSIHALAYQAWMFLIHRIVNHLRVARSENNDYFAPALDDLQGVWSITKRTLKLRNAPLIVIFFYKAYPTHHFSMTTNCSGWVSTKPTIT